MQGRRFVLVPGNENTGVSDLHFQEFARYVGSALGRGGLTEVQTLEGADTAVFVAYGIGDPQTHLRTRSIPVYRRVSGGGRTDFQATARTSTGRYTTVSGSVTEQPQYAWGTQQVTTETTTYFRYLVVWAVDVRTFLRTNQIRELWRTEATSRGSLSDLRRIMPALVAASMPYFGRTTGRRIQVTLRERSDAIATVRGE